MIKTIYIARHGQTDYNKKKIIQGSGVDSSLNEKGRAQAHAFYEQYKDIPFEVVLTSALKRTHETGKGFIDKGIQWEQFAEINEICWGIHEGKSYTPELEKDYKQMIAAWQAGDFTASVEEGESAIELSTRLNHFINHLKARTEQHILVFSHGRAMRCLICLMKGLPLQNMEGVNHHNTGLYKATLSDGQFTFELENDIQHLEIADLI